MIVELVLAAVIALAAGLGGGYMLRRSTAEKAIGSAEAQAKKIVEEAEAKASGCRRAQPLPDRASSRHP